MSDKDLRQSTNYTCGPACVRYILEQFDIHVSERTVSEAVHATPEFGVDPLFITAYFINQGIPVEELKQEEGEDIDINRYLATLQEYLDDGKMILVDYLAGDDLDEDGHYAVLLDINGQNVTIWDPSLGEEKSLTLPYFVDHWKDTDRNGEIFRKWALVVGL